VGSVLSSTHFRSIKGKRSPDHPRNSQPPPASHIWESFCFLSLVVVVAAAATASKASFRGAAATATAASATPSLPPPKWCSDFAMAAVTACSLSKSTALFVAASSFSSSKLPVSRPSVVAIKTSSSFSLQERRLCRFSSSSSSSSQGFVVPSVSPSLNDSCLSRKAYLRGFFLLVVLGLLHLFVESFWMVF